MHASGDCAPNTNARRHWSTVQVPIPGRLSRSAGSGCSLRPPVRPFLPEMSMQARESFHAHSSRRISRILLKTADRAAQNRTLNGTEDRQDAAQPAPPRVSRNSVYLTRSIEFRTYIQYLLDAKIMQHARLRCHLLIGVLSCSRPGRRPLLPVPSAVRESAPEFRLQPRRRAEAGWEQRIASRAPAPASLRDTWSWSPADRIPRLSCAPHFFAGASARKRISMAFRSQTVHENKPRCEIGRPLSRWQAHRQAVWALRLPSTRIRLSGRGSLLAGLQPVKGRSQAIERAASKLWNKEGCMPHSNSTRQMQYRFRMRLSAPAPA